MLSRPTDVRFFFAYGNMSARRNAMPLTLKPFASLRTSLAGSWRVFQYTVVGDEQGMSIAHMGWLRGWQFYRWDGLGWRGSYKSADEALAAIEKVEAYVHEKSRGEATKERVPGAS